MLSPDTPKYTIGIPKGTTQKEANIQCFWKISVADEFVGEQYIQLEFKHPFTQFNSYNTHDCMHEVVRIK